MINTIKREYNVYFTTFNKTISLANQDDLDLFTEKSENIQSLLKLKADKIKQQKYDHTKLVSVFLPLLNSENFPLQRPLKIVSGKLDLPICIDEKGLYVRSSGSSNPIGKFSNVFKKIGDTKKSLGYFWKLDEKGKISVSTNNLGVIYQLIEKCLTDDTFNNSKKQKTKMHISIELQMMC